MTVSGAGTGDSRPGATKGVRCLRTTDWLRNPGLSAGNNMKNPGRIQPESMRDSVPACAEPEEIQASPTPALKPWARLRANSRHLSGQEDPDRLRRIVNSARESQIDSRNLVRRSTAAQKGYAPRPGDDSLRSRIFQTMDDPTYSSPARFVSLVVMFVIVISTVSFVLESEATETGGVLYANGDNQTAKDIFMCIEFVSVIIFTLEYAVRLFTCQRTWPFVIDFLNVVDVVAFAPFWITLAIEGKLDSDSGNGFGFVRVIRLVRVFRVFKFGRYSVGIQMFVGAILKSRQPLGVLLFMIAINTIILASVMYLLEDSPSNDMLSAVGVDKSLHDVCFGTIPRAFWWCIVTMTTVGYGDCYPLTVSGRVVAMFTMLLGVLILALPITVVGSNFHKMVEMFEEDMDDYSKTDKDDSGAIDEFELRSYIAKQKKDGLIRRGADTHAGRLMAKYDPQANGTLSMIEFTQLKNDIIDESKNDASNLLKRLSSQMASQQKQIEELTQTVGRFMRSQDERMERIEQAVLDKSGGCSPSASSSNSVLPELASFVAPTLAPAPAHAPIKSVRTEDDPKERTVDGQATS